MPRDMQHDALRFATEALEKFQVEEEIASYIADKFDEKYHSSWACNVECDVQCDVPSDWWTKSDGFWEHPPIYWIDFRLDRMTIRLWKYELFDLPTP
ncbi:hypothetical protein HPB47_001439 [Ixodes persulcatus]|uniref:Uncharacterized protein n=1 Tax=Ixodes persulcatus TaxID=34615 RepID=A0AC60PP13_IXOPE|nr:hypothetical protein HPB47_001439 [Ixodes persulcatus]